MKKEELKLLITISIILSIVVSILYIIVLKKEFNLEESIRAISFGISTTTIFWTFFFSIGWKVWGFRKIFYRPNINGTWGGILKSNWKDKDHKVIGDIEFYIIIRQSFLSIHFTTFTKSFTGTSYSETFSLQKEKGLKNVAYLYRKETSQEDDKVLQEGAAELKLIDSKVRKLQGKYWSNRKTKGKINVCFISKSTVDSFEDAKSLKK
ncbi:hypothetical protein [Kordia sp.]|uniref:Cap15 family cyclic dinucleotide receptor domain-containing protein n=1 Tax=Kordia sp. TaxID=1965332 RepID=UPI003B5928BC